MDPSGTLPVGPHSVGCDILKVHTQGAPYGVRTAPPGGPAGGEIWKKKIPLSRESKFSQATYSCESESAVAKSLSLMGLSVEPHPPPNAGLISQPLCFFISLYFIQKCSPAFSPPRNLQELFDKLVGSPKTHGACLQQNPERIHCGKLLIKHFL